MKQIYKAIIAALVLIAIAATVFTNAHAGEDRPVLGGWTEEEKTITEEQKEIFDQALEGLVGVDYVPVELVGTQLVNGTNYRFLCEARTVVPGAETRHVIITIHQKLSGETEILNIEDAGDTYMHTK